MNLPLKNSNRTMNLLTKTAIRGIPQLGDQDGKGRDAKVHLKFFMEGWTWYLTELDPETGQAFGLVISPMEPRGELGYFDMNELAGLRGSVGQGVDRDKFFKPQPLRDVDPSKGN